MELKDVLGTSLSREKRIQSLPPVMRRVFISDSYEIFFCLYADALLTALIYFKSEGLRVMISLGEAPVIQASTSADAWVEAALGLLRVQGRGPFHLIRDAKLETTFSLTLHDRATLRLAQVEVPRSAGRFRETFLKDSDS